MVGAEETHATPEPGVTGLVASRARFADFLGGARLDARDRSVERPAAHRVAARLPVRARARGAGFGQRGGGDRGGGRRALGGGSRAASDPAVGSRAHALTLVDADAVPAGVERAGITVVAVGVARARTGREGRSGGGGARRRGRTARRAVDVERGTWVVGPAGLARAREPDRVEAPELHRAALAVVQLADARRATLAIAAVGLPVTAAHGRVLLRARDGPLGARAAGSVTAPRATLAELVRPAVAVAPATGRAACRLAGEHGVPDHTARAATTEAALADGLLGERRCAAPDLAGRAERTAVTGARDVRLDGSHRGQVARQLATSGTRLGRVGGGHQQTDPDERDSHATPP